MAIQKDMDGMSKGLEKILTQLSSIYKVSDDLSKTSGSMARNLSGLGASSPIMANSARFGGQTATTTQQTTSNGMPVASFGGVAAGLGVAAAKFGWSATPGVQDAYTHQNMLFQSAFFTGGAYSNAATFGKIRASFGNTATGMFDQQAAAVMMTNRGVDVGSRSFGRSAGEAGFMSRMTGMSNVASASGSLALQSGAGVSGRLAQYGIFTNSLSNGQYGGMGAVIDQLWARWYGSPSAKVPYVRFQADLLGGYLGQDLRVLFGDQPELYQMIVSGLQLKAKAGGMSGIDFSENAKGAKSAKSLATKYGMTSQNNPLQTQMGITSSQVGALNASSGVLIQGFEDAAGVIVAYNKSLENLASAHNAIFDMAMRTKGALETLGSTSEGSAGMGALLSGGAALLGGALGRGGVGRLGLGAASRLLPAAGAGTVATGALGAAGLVAGGAAALFAGNSAVNSLRDAGIAQRGGVWDSLGTIAGMAGTGAAAGALLGAPFAGVGAAPGAVIGTIVGTAAGIGKVMFGSGAGGSLGSPDSAVSWATNTAGVDGQKWRQLCDRFVANAYGLPRSGYASARSHWQSIPARYKHPGDMNPPAGALVFWNNGQYGHVAISTGSGAVRTTHLNGGTPTTVGLAECTRQLGGQGVYLGWAEPYFGGRVLSKTGGASSDGTTSPQKGSTGDDATASAMAAIGVSPMSAYEMASPLMSRMGTTDLTVYGASYGSPDAATANGSASPTMRSGPNSKAPVLDGSVDQRRFASSLLQGIGAPTSDSNMTAMLTWMRHEGGHWRNKAHYNPLNTTWKKPGARPMSKRNPGIKAYTDWDTGLQATIDTLLKGNEAYGYSKIVDAFRNGASSGDIYSAIEASKWGTKNLPSMAHGSEYVSRDGAVNLHQGEMIIPASQATTFREALREALGTRRSSGDVTINLKIDKASDEEAERFAHRVMQILRTEQRNERLRTR